MDGKNYAVVNAEQIEVMPVSFQASENGIYTLSFSMYVLRLINGDDVKTQKIVIE